LVSGIFLIGYWVMLYFGGDYSMLGNAGDVIDKVILGETHMYHGEGVAFEPEGILSTLPSVVNVVFGYYAGLFVQEKGKTYETISKLLIAGFVCLCTAYFWDLVFPINKKLRTSSFVFYTVGLDMILMGVLIYVIEIRSWNKWTYFFEVFGRNPLSIYLLSELLVTLFYMIRTPPRVSLYQAINN